MCFYNSRFPKLPIRRHVQENSLLISPLLLKENSKSVVPLTQREQHERESEIYEKSRIKLEYFEMAAKNLSNRDGSSQMNNILYKDGIQKIMVN